MMPTISRITGSVFIDSYSTVQSLKYIVMVGASGGITAHFPSDLSGGNVVEMHQETVDGIEVIHAVPAGRRHQPLPTVFFYHGYTSSKEVYSYFGYALAKAGFRVILPDALMHGARFNGDEKQRLGHFWEILRANIDELPALKAHFEQQGMID